LCDCGVSLSFPRGPDFSILHWSVFHIFSGG
jgi:hypothetical protein